MRRFRLTRSKQFARDDQGAVLVEFALTFPVMLLFLALVVEMSRMLWSYQVAVSGVRDASRYLGRRVPLDICVGSTATNVPLTGVYDDEVTVIVSETLQGGSAFLPAVTVDDVAPVYSCKPTPAGAGSPYRVNPAPVARVTASLTMAIPMSGLFSFFGSIPSSITTQVSSESRVFGL
jgi:Flp pilus assembly protein TadG